MRIGIGNRIEWTVAVTVLLIAGITHQAGAVKTTGGEYNTLHAGLGAEGYDVVSYFAEGKPAVGSAEFTHAYRGVAWRFVSKEHRDLFVKTPAKYAPQYGGFCAWGVAAGKLFDVDPVNGWTIVDGKLYLNFNAELNGVFASDPAGFITKAARHWPKLDR